MIVNAFTHRNSFYEFGYASDIAGVYYCKNISNYIRAVNLPDVKAKCYVMPEWKEDEGKEEIEEHEFICAELLTPFILP